MRIVGILLIAALMVLPVSRRARRLEHELVVLLAMGIGLLSASPA